MKKQIDQEDINIIKNMTEKYELTLKELMMAVSKEVNVKSVLIQVRLTDEEKNIIEKKALNKNMNRSSFIQSRLEEFVNTKDDIIYEKYNFFESDIRRKDRKYVTISLPPFLLNKVREKAKKLKLNVSFIIRYLCCEMD